MERKFVFWVLYFLMLLLAAIIIPFTLLRKVESIYGSFLFWGLFALVAMISIGIITGQWRD